MAGSFPAVELRDTLALLDYAGVALFALTGALVAARRGQTIVTFAFFAAVTGVGGGTLRDLLIDAPVFWVVNDRYLLVCLAAALVVWLSAAARWPMRALLWLDAVGLAAYAVIGAAKAIGAGVTPLVAIIMGVLTATVGGIVRDVLAGQESIVLGREIYISAAALAAAVFVGLSLAGVPLMIAGTIGALAGFTLRAGALARGWKLPGYKR